MKIAFISGNREKLPDAVVPIGLLYIMANTPDCHDKELIDLCFVDDPDAHLKETLGKMSPDVVALGMRNIQNNDYSGMEDNLNYYADLIVTIRKSCSASVVLGGSGFSVMPKELMARLKPDYGISGEGEQAFPKLLKALETGEGINAIGALHRYIDGQILSSPRPPEFLDMNTLIPPDRSLAAHTYYQSFGVDSIQTKRGCPLRCDYCTYPIIEGRVGRTRDPVAVVDEMFAAANDCPDINHFFIVDSVFNLPKTHAKKVCRELIKRNWTIPWTCYANPLGFDTEFAELAKAAGCAGMEVGSDSGVNHVLKKMHKGFTTDHIRKLHNTCETTGIPDCHTFIIGTEGETIEDVQQTLDFIADLDPFSVFIMIWIDDFEALDPGYRAERMAFRKDIEVLLEANKDKFPTWSVPALKINFNERLFAALRKSGRHGPLWQHIRG
ncbi:MAG: radical SAM protein [Gammaproteobacteria bacterium]|nr:radical SAM protein [Gammaproteobacteria bacterium]